MTMSLASYRSSVLSENGPPVSLEAERRRTMAIVHRVEKEVVAFREKWVKKTKTQFTDDMPDLVQFVTDRNQVKRYPKNINDFTNLLSKVRDSAETLYKTEVELIESAIMTVNAFKEAMASMRSKLTEALQDHVGKYCHSYSAETGIHDISSVQFYENNITRWRGQIKEAFTLLDDIMRNIHESCMNFEVFLQNYSRVVHYMGLSLDVFPRIFNAFKDWVTSDEAYVRRLQDDMSELKREKMNIDNIFRRHKQAAGGIQSKVTRSQHHTKTLKEKLYKARDERRQYRKRELSMMEASSKIAINLKAKKLNLEDTLQQIYIKEEPTKSARDRLVQSSGALSEEIAKLEKKMSNMKSDLRNMKMERLAAQKEFHKLQVLCDKNSKLQNDIQDDAYDASQDLRDLEEERRVLGEKVMALARIRAIKLDPQTVKVIYAEGYIPGRKFDVPEPLEEACRVTAAEIGSDWPPVKSPRRENNNTGNSTSRSLDISGTESLSPRADARHRGAGYGSVDRWSKLSQEASVNALSRTLRSMKAREEAERGERKIITVN